MTSGPYQLLPRLSELELITLRESIEQHGIQVPIVVDEDGNVLDGHHRQLLADTLGMECPKEVRHGLDEAAKRTLAYSLNVNRRQMDQAQKRALVADSLLADPELSDRQHASRVGVDHKTIALSRASLERRGEIPHVEVRTDTKGRKVGAKPPAKQPEDRGEGEPAPASGVTLAAPDPASTNADAGHAAGDSGVQPGTAATEPGAAGSDLPVEPAAETEPEQPETPLELAERAGKARVKAHDLFGRVDPVALIAALDHEGLASWDLTVEAAQRWIDGWNDNRTQPLRSVQ